MNLFAKSPFKPLTEHAEKIKVTVEKMDVAVKAYVEGADPQRSRRCTSRSASSSMKRTP